MKKVSTVGERTEAVVGLDLSDKKGTYVMLSWRGSVVAEGQVALTLAGLEAQFQSRRYRIALEAGSHSPWVSRALACLGHEVLVANPRQVPLIYRSHRKNDRMDALSLARLARLDPALLYPISHRSEQAQQDLALLHSRDELVAARTRLINHVRGVAKSLGQRLPASTAPAFARNAAGQQPEALKPALTPTLAIIAQLSQTIQQYDKDVERLARESYPVTRVLQQLNGVGALTALAYVLTLEEPQRFARSRDVGAYLGLTPRQRDSGESTPQLHISKAGDGFLRRLLVQCAHYILGPFGQDCDLRRWGLRLAGTSKAGKKRAVAAVARRLAVLLHRLWLTGEVYTPLRQAA